MSERCATWKVLDLATRPILVPLYLAAARLSVPAVRRRKARRDLEPGGDPLDRPDCLREIEVPPAPIRDEDCPRASVVVPVFNGEKVLARLLESIRALDYPRDRLEVIVADNGSTDRSPEVAREFGAKVVVQTKRGPAAARNAAIAAATGEYVAMTDADTVVHPLWLKHLVAAAVNARGEYAAVGGRVLSLCDDPIIRDFCVRECVLDQEASIAGRLLPYPFAITANALFRREAFHAVGGFDEEFADAAAEDVDLGWRFTAAGHRMAYAPHACVFHRQRARGVDIHAQFYKYGLSEVRLYLKHRDRFAPRDLSRHLWIRPILYRHFWQAAWRSLATRDYPTRRLWRLTALKELGHMAGKLEGARRWRTRRYFSMFGDE